MTREHAPRPGITWQQAPGRRETVVPDDPQSLCGQPQSDQEPRLNRRERRAQQRANRQKGQHR